MIILGEDFLLKCFVCQWIDTCYLRSRNKFVKKSYEVKSLLILHIFSEDEAYDIKIMFWKFRQDQNTFYFIRFFHKVVAAAQMTCVKSLLFQRVNSRFSNFEAVRGWINNNEALYFRNFTQCQSIGAFCWTSRNLYSAGLMFRSANFATLENSLL